MPALSRILYVDDEHDVRVVAEIALSRIGGYDVTACASGEEALTHLDEYGTDLVLLDVMMPGMDGLTARHQPYDLHRYRILGVAGVIPKPFDPMALASQVQNIWDGLNRAAAG